MENCNQVDITCDVQHCRNCTSYPGPDEMFPLKKSARNILVGNISVVTGTERKVQVKNSMDGKGSPLKSKQEEIRSKEARERKDANAS